MKTYCTSREEEGRPAGMCQHSRALKELPGSTRPLPSSGSTQLTPIVFLCCGGLPTYLYRHWCSRTVPSSAQEPTSRSLMGRWPLEDGTCKKT